MRRAIVLPERKSKPYFKWLSVSPGSDDRAAKVFSGDLSGQFELDVEIDDNLGVPKGDREQGLILPDPKKAFGEGSGSRVWEDLGCGTMGSGQLLDQGSGLPRT